MQNSPNWNRFSQNSQATPGQEEAARKAMAGKMLASLRKETRERAAARERTRLEAESVEEAARLAGANNTRFAVYRRNPEGFIVHQLGGCLWSKQREIARSV